MKKTQDFLLRLAKEKLLFEQNRPSEAELDELSLKLWKITFPGPVDTCWEGYRYSIIFDLSEFPTTLEAKFSPPIPHPNVASSNGHICFGLLKEEECWRPSFSLTTVLISIMSTFMMEPNPDSAYYSEATNKAKESLEAWQEYVREYLEQNFTEYKDD